MRLCTFYTYDATTAGVLLHDRVIALDDLNEAWGQDFGPDLSHLIRRGQADELAAMLRGKIPQALAQGGWRPEAVRYALPFADPPKIWGIGLNYKDHAADLGAATPEEPGSFMRPATSLVEPGAALRVPAGIGKVTAEGELGVVLGARLKDATPQEARDAVLAYTCVIDCTGEDLLKKNLRYLARAKSYDSFGSFGPWLVTRDEWEPTPATRVRTLHNGKLHREAPVSQMHMQPWDLIAYHSRVFTWQPGDLLMTGTPGAAGIQSGDIVSAEVDGLPALSCRVA